MLILVFFLNADGTYSYSMVEFDRMKTFSLRFFQVDEDRL